MRVARFLPVVRLVVFSMRSRACEYGSRVVRLVFTSEYSLEFGELFATISARVEHRF